MPNRIQLSRANGWRMPENTVKVDRTTHFGNPWQPNKVARDISIVTWRGKLAKHNGDLIRAYLSKVYTETQEVIALKVSVEMHSALIRNFKTLNPTEFEAWIKPLRGKNLACWCRQGQPCHADVLLELANA